MSSLGAMTTLAKLGCLLSRCPLARQTGDSPEQVRQGTECVHTEIGEGSQHFSSSSELTPGLLGLPALSVRSVPSWAVAACDVPALYTV